MNYIKRLQGENEELRKNLENAETELQEFRRFLCTSKFEGVDLDGSFKNWINTSDVHNHLNIILDAMEGTDINRGIQA